MTPITEKQVNQVISLVRELADDADTQLTILALAFVAGAKSVEVDKATMLLHISNLYDDPGELVKYDS